METQWIFAGLLGLGLAASCGLNTFLPLLALSGAAHWKLFGVNLGGNFSWLGSEAALVALGLATMVEVIGDKVPFVDHALDAFGTVARPAAGALAAASVFNGEPALAALAGLVVGAPAAFSFHAVKTGTRAASTTTTWGLANPLLSTIEDILAVALVFVSFVAPIVVPVLLIVAFLLVWKLVKRLRGTRAPAV